SLLIWVGGALGGAFNALVAPVVFDRVVEYPLVLVVACMLRPAPRTAGAASGARASDLLLPLLLLALLLGLPTLQRLDFSQLEANATLVVVAGGALAAALLRPPPLRRAPRVGPR